MKKLIHLSVALGSSGSCLAQEIAHVISSTPILQQVGVDRQVCSTDPAIRAQPKSDAKASVADAVQGANSQQIQSTQQCETQTFYENRAVAYSVVYELGGKLYSVQLPNDPGTTLFLRVGPTSSAASISPTAATVTFA